MVYGLIWFCLAQLALAQDHGHDHDAAVNKDADVAATLSPELRTLLRQEMLALRDGMSGLAVEISQGGWQSVAEIAAKMRDSYILKKSLTAGHKKELAAKLPPGFAPLDRRFHETAGKLVHAARKRDAELSVFYQTRLLEACVRCHADFAPARFPDLTQAEPAHEH